MKSIKNDNKLTPSLRTSRGTDEAAADNTVCQQLYDNLCFPCISCTHYI